MKHVGKNLKNWRRRQGLTQIQLAHALPEPLTDGQMIRHYERASDWFGSPANGEWLVEQGAFSRDCLPSPASNGTHTVANGPDADKGQAA